MPACSRELGLPRSEFLPALLCFNAGVELGQLTVILAAFLLIGLPFRNKPWYRRRIVVPLSLAIAAVGLYWAIQRIAAADPFPRERKLPEPRARQSAQIAMNDRNQTLNRKSITSPS